MSENLMLYACLDNSHVSLL